MYPISTALKEAFESGAPQYARITIGQTVIENSRIRERSLSVNRYAVSEDTVLFGSCVAAEMKVTLDNRDGLYSSEDFRDNEAFLEVGCEVNGVVDYVPMGYFTFDDVEKLRSTISLSALDRMVKFEIEVPDSFYEGNNGHLTTIVSRICTACGVPKGTFTFPTTYVFVTEDWKALSGESIKTYRDLLRYIGEVTGTIAYIDCNGYLMFGWYSTTTNFTVDSSNRRNGLIAEEATTLGSVSIVWQDDMVSAGSGAKIVIRDNPLTLCAYVPLMTPVTAQTIATTLAGQVDGFSYRTFQAEILPAPNIMPLDKGVYTDAEGNDYTVFCTDFLFVLNGGTSVAGKGGKKSHGRGYTMNESVFTAVNIAANAVTADKINVQDLAALRATIAGWGINWDAIYKDITIDNYTYRVQLHAPLTPTASTPAFSVSRKPTATPSASWEYVTEIMYDGKVISKDLTANGRVRITPDYSVQSEPAMVLANPYDGSTTSVDSRRIDMQDVDGASHLEPYSVEFETRDGSTVEVVCNGSSFQQGSGIESGITITVNRSPVQVSKLTEESLVVNNRDILRTHRSLVGGYATSIPANADLNNIAYLSVGRYICASDATAASLSNSPAEYAFFMEVLAPISDTIDNESTGTGVYRIQKITRFDGVEYTRKANSGSTAGTFTFEPWYRKHDARVSEENSAYWMKTQTSRPSSLDFTHIGTDSRGHMRLDLSTSAQTGGVNAVFGEGFVQTFMWDTNAKWDAQFYIPDDDGKSPAFRTYNASSNTWSEVKRCVCETEGTTTIDGIEWTWQKYTDGYVDMYADITVRGTWTSWGNQYVLRNANSTTYQLPFTLSKKLVDTTSVVGWEGDTACYPVNYTSIVQTGVSESYTTCDIGRPSAGSNNTNYYCRKYIRGKLQTSRNLLHMA